MSQLSSTPSATRFSWSVTRAGLRSPWVRFCYSEHHDAGTYVAPSRQTVASYLTEEWLPAIKHTVMPSTLLSYQGHVRNHIAPHLGSVQLQKLNGSHVNQLYVRLLGNGLSPTTVSMAIPKSPLVAN